MFFFRLTGVTHHERLALTAALEATLTTCGCWITDSHLYSNISLCLAVELPRRRISELLANLEQLPVRFVPDELLALAALAGAEGDAAGTVQVTFVHGEPDLRRLVPPIPG